MGLRETATPVSPLIAPKEPIAGDVKDRAIKLTDLDRSQMDIFKIMYDQYKMKVQAYQREFNKQQKELKK